MMQSQQVHELLWCPVPFTCVVHPEIVRFLMCVTPDRDPTLPVSATLDIISTDRGYQDINGMTPQDLTEAAGGIKPRRCTALALRTFIVLCRRHL